MSRWAIRSSRLARTFDVLAATDRVEVLRSTPAIEVHTADQHLSRQPYMMWSA
jgi:hypothetical protein